MVALAIRAEQLNLSRFPDARRLIIYEGKATSQTRRKSASMERNSHPEALPAPGLNERADLGAVAIALRNSRARFIALRQEADVALREIERAAAILRQLAERAAAQQRGASKRKVRGA